MLSKLFNNSGLDILHGILLNIPNHPQAAQSFYQSYYIMILQHIFSVVTDTSHTAGMLWIITYYFLLPYGSFWFDWIGLMSLSLEI